MMEAFLELRDKGTHYLKDLALHPLLYELLLEGKGRQDILV
jgi:hypothetical protein